MAKNRRNGMENTPIKLARTFWVFCMSYKLIKESNQSLQISAFRIGDRKTEISKFVDFTLFWCLGLTIFEAWASTSPGGWASKSTGAWASKIVIWKIRFFRYVGSFSTQFSGSTIEILRTPTNFPSAFTSWSQKSFISYRPRNSPFFRQIWFSIREVSMLGQKLFDAWVSSFLMPGLQNFLMPGLQNFLMPGLQMFLTGSKCKNIKNWLKIKSVLERTARDR